MDRKLKKYEHILINYLEKYAQDWNSLDMEYQFLRDTKNHLYQVVRFGWDSKNVFRFIPIFHFQIKENAKVWIFVNNTDIDIAKDLIELGVHQNDIVLGFHPEKYRGVTGYAVA